MLTGKNSRNCFKKKVISLGLFYIHEVVKKFPQNSMEIESFFLFLVHVSNEDWIYILPIFSFSYLTFRIAKCSLFAMWKIIG